jgi:hypothetical protein
VRGLAECLRVTPPRLEPGTPPGLSRRMWEAAKAYWMPPDASDIASVAAVVAGGGAAGSAATGSTAAATGSTAAAAAGAGAGAGAAAGSTAAAAAAANSEAHGPTKTVLNGVSAAGPTHAAGAGPSRGGELAGLVARVKSGGLQLTKAQVEAARKLLELREADKTRRGAFVAALWGLSVIGGSWLFEEETEALLQVRRREGRALEPGDPQVWPAGSAQLATGAGPRSSAVPALVPRTRRAASRARPVPGPAVSPSKVAAPSLPAWPLTGREAADVLWALANARHWTPLLPALEAAVLRAGGLRALRPPQLAAALWAFATLGHAPAAALAGLAEAWAGAGRGGGPRVLQAGQLAAVVWSLAAMGRADSDAFRLAWAEVGRRGLGMGGQKHHLVQVWQAALARRLEAPGHAAAGESSDGGGGCDGGGEAQLLAAAEAAFVGEAAALRGQVGRGAGGSWDNAVAEALLAPQRRLSAAAA